MSIQDGISSVHDSYERQISELKLRAERAESERDKALAACAEMLAALQHCIVYLQCDECIGLEFCSACKRTHGIVVEAKSTDCGKGWLSPEKAKELEAELSECREKNLWCVNEHLKLQKQVKLLVEALEKIKTITDDPESHVIAR